MGAVLRDNNGEIILAASMKERTLLLLEATECIAIPRGLQLYIPLGINKLIVETNCQLIMQ